MEGDMETVEACDCSGCPAHAEGDMKGECTCADHCTCADCGRTEETAAV